MESPRTRNELDKLFQECFQAYEKDESIPNEKLQMLVEAVSHFQIFSSNEEFEDVDTSDLGFILVDFWLAQTLLKAPQEPPFEPTKRLKKLDLCKAIFDRFLYRLVTLKLHKEIEEKETTKTQPPTREEKISRFKKKKEALDKIKSSKDQREIWKLRIEVALVEALDEQDNINREIEVLNYMIKERPETAARNNDAPPPKKPIQVTQVGPNLEIKKETFQNGVFKPYHRLPTISLEEYAEMEMKKMEENTRKAKENPTKTTLSLTELYEQGLEDDKNLEEAATLKARKWDDWKDGVPKGSGVTKRF